VSPSVGELLINFANGTIQNTFVSMLEIHHTDTSATKTATAAAQSAMECVQTMSTHSLYAQ